MLETWKTELDSIIDRFDNVAQNRKDVMEEWDKVIKEALIHKEQMFASLDAYRTAIEKAVVEIQNVKDAANQVLKHKGEIEQDTEKLLQCKE